jgi:hypothetical protein
MGVVVYRLRWLIDCFLRILDPLPALLSLTILAILTAWIMVVAIARVSPQRQLARARDQMAASIYEMRLFLDAPRRVLAAQARLIGWTVAYILCMVPSALVLAIPLGLLFLQLDIRHGVAPIKAPATLVAHIALAPGVDGRTVTLTSDDAAIETTAPLLFADDEPAVYARLRVARPGTHHLVVHTGSETIDKLIVASPGDRVAPERSSGLAELWSLGTEPPIDSSAVVAISIPHPKQASLRVGVGPVAVSMPWWIYWLGLSTILAFVLAKRRGIAM